jgi:ribosome biogenesis protein BRX1
VPKTARRAKPFVDHVTSFSVSDGKIWFRNYQIIHDAPLDLSKASAAADEAPEEIARKAMKLSKNAEDNMSMNEIGPRFVLTPVKIFEGSFGGAVVWENKGELFALLVDPTPYLLLCNTDWVTPQAKLQNAKLAKAIEYKSRKGQEVERKGRKEFLETQELTEREASGRAALDKRRVFA